MKAMMKRSRMFETLAVPDEEERQAMPAIFETRRQRLGTDCDRTDGRPIKFSHRTSSQDAG